jgi:purine-cytosine permease-like protein
MDFKTLLPDFNAIGKTDWAKPDLKIDTKDTFKLVALAGAVLMLVFVFLPWTSINVTNPANITGEGSKLGIATWYGVFALIMALVAVVGMLYKHTSLTFCAAVLGVIFGLIGLMSFPEMQITFAHKGKEITETIKNKEEWEEGIKMMKSSSLSHLGAILFTVASVVTAAGAYLKITKK